MKFSKGLLAAMLLVILIACNARYGSTEDATTIAEQPNEKVEQLGGIVDSTYSPPGNNKQDQKQPDNFKNQNPDWDKRIVKNGNLKLEVEKMEAFNTTVRDIVKRAGGYIAQEEQNNSDYKNENTVTIKVPVDQFETVISSLTTDQKIIERKISSQDVTAEVVDTKSRIEAKRQVRERYLDFLKQARNMEEILRVQNEINFVQEQIEAASGRVNYLSHASAMSTIQLTYYQIVGVKTPDEKEPGFGERMLQGFKNGAVWIGEFLIFLINIWPVWLGVSLLVIAFKKIKPKEKSV